MGVESGPGTSAARLAELGSAVGARLGAIRQCYAEVTEQRPTVTGQMKLRVTVPQRGQAQIETTLDETNDAPLARCVLRAVRAMSADAVQRPASAVVNLTFTNTAARGIEEGTERRQEAERATVTREPDGRLLARGGTEGGEVRFRVNAESTAPEARVQAVQRTVRAAIPGMLDCRRRASRRGASPAGDIAIELTIARNGRARTRVASSTVADERAPQCLTRAISRERFPAEAAGATTVTVRFADATPVQAAEAPPARPTPARR